jgi:hypothetical protein
MAAFEIGGGQIVEHQTTRGEMALGECLLNARLTGQEPVHGLVEFGLVGGIDREQLAETAVKGIGVKAPSGGEFGGGVEDTGHDHGDDEIAVAASTTVLKRNNLV